MSKTSALDNYLNLNKFFLSLIGQWPYQLPAERNFIRFLGHGICTFILIPGVSIWFLRDYILMLLNLTNNWVAFFKIKLKVWMMGSYDCYISLTLNLILIVVLQLIALYNVRHDTTVFVECIPPLFTVFISYCYATFCSLNLSRVGIYYFSLI